MRKLLAICAVALIAFTTGSVTKALTATNWVEYSLNPVYTDKNGKAYYPTAIKEGDVYKMWYASHTDMRMTTSSDGINWTAPAVCNGLTNPNHPLVKKIGNTYRIWYWDTLAKPVPYTIDSIRTAISTNGVNWEPDQPITQDDTYQLITGAGTGWNRGSYGPGDVIYNPSGYDSLDDTNIWNNKYVMYYMATNGTNEYIGLAYSVNGKHWKRYGNAPVLSPCIEADNPSVGWDYRSVGYPTVIKDADGTWHMWFCGGPNTNHGIGYAWSNDGINWAKDAANPIFHKDDGVTWRHERTYTPVVIGNQMWFSGKDAGTGIYAVGYATSNSPPVADAGPDQTVEQESYAGTVIILDGSGSTDPDSTPGTNDDIVYFDWWEGDTPLWIGEIINYTFPLGSHVVTLLVTDFFGETDDDEVIITVVDTTPPEVACSVNPEVLWPPNHRMVPVIVFIEASDICTKTDDLTLVVTAENSEPDDDNGDGAFTGDVDGEDGFTSPVDVSYAFSPDIGGFVGVIDLRAECDGRGVHRIYTITATVKDVSGNETTASCDVIVPHHQGKGKK